jgi:hypothetical protein
MCCAEQCDWALVSYANASAALKEVIKPVALANNVTVVMLRGKLHYMIPAYNYNFAYAHVVAFVLMKAPWRW